MVFVNIALIGELFDIGYNVSISEQLIVIDGSPVPNETMILRQRTRDRLLGRTEQSNQDENITHGQHHWIVTPRVKITSSSRWNRKTSKMTSNLQTVFDMDLLKTRTKLVTQSNASRALTDIRI